MHCITEDAKGAAPANLQQGDQQERQGRRLTSPIFICPEMCFTSRLAAQSWRGSVQNRSSQPRQPLRTASTPGNHDFRNEIIQPRLQICAAVSLKRDVKGGFHPGSRRRHDAALPAPSPPPVQPPRAAGGKKVGIGFQRLQRQAEEGIHVGPT
jgi:hypothetical protein